MAEKVSVKTASAIFLLCTVILALCACVVPVDIDAFLGDPEVDKVIKSTKDVVLLGDNNTGDDLVGRDRRIEGLKNNKYYMIEKEIDPKDNLPVPGYPQYVTDHHPTSPQIPGAPCGDLGYITRIKDGRINGLLNHHTYTIRDAKPIAPTGGKLSFKDSLISASRDVNVVNGKIIITNIVGATNKGYLNLSSVITADYEVMAVSVDNPNSSPWSWRSRSTTSSPSISLNPFELQGAGTKVDYVFVNKKVSPPDFKFLSVEIGPSVELVDVTLDITFNVVNGEPTLSSSDGNTTFKQPDYYDGVHPTITINISGLEGYIVVDWIYDGKKLDPSLGTTTPIINSTNNIDYFTEGIHTLTVIVRKGIIVYSADFTFKVIK